MQINLSERRVLRKTFASGRRIADSLEAVLLKDEAPAYRSTAFYVSLAAFVLLTNAAVCLDIPLIRPLMGFAFLAVLPGALILRIFRLNWTLPLESRIALSTGLSLSFSMLIGLFANWLYPLLGYNSPLSTASMRATLTPALIILISIAYLRDARKDNIRKFNIGLDISAREKALLIISSAFPLLSILGTERMNATGNNDILMALLFSITVFVALMSLVRDKASKDFYPLTILFISVSLVLLLGLRSHHIIGADIHAEYYLFQATINEGRWYQAFAGDEIYGPLDACLSISILPAVYQSFMKVSPEYLFKTLYPLVFSVSPLVVYSISRRYIDQFCSFLASMFFMSQLVFLITAYNPRTVIAILFFALLIMVTLDDRFEGSVKKGLFIVLSISCILSHYTTTYILIFTLTAWFCLKTIVEKLGSYRPHMSAEGAACLKAENNGKPLVTLRTLILLYAMIFFWYGQVTGAAFDAGVTFVCTAIRSMSDFLTIGARGTGLDTAFGIGILSQPIPQKISFIFSWLVVVFLCLGIAACIARYCAQSSSIGAYISDILERELDRDYFLLSLISLGVLIASVILPQVGKGYGMDRVYFQMMVLLSPFIILGLKAGIGLLHARNKRLMNTGRINVRLMALALLIPYFLANSGAMYEVFGMDKAVTLSSSGQMYEAAYIHDQETFGASWLNNTAVNAIDVYSDFYGTRRLMSQGGISSAIYPSEFIEEGEKLPEGYFYLRYYGAIYGKLMDSKYLWHNLVGNTSNGYAGDFGYRNLIYSNGGSRAFL